MNNLFNYQNKLVTYQDKLATYSESIKSNNNILDYPFTSNDSYPPYTFSTYSSPQTESCSAIAYKAMKSVTGVWSCDWGPTWYPEQLRFYISLGSVMHLYKVSCQWNMVKLLSSASPFIAIYDMYENQLANYYASSGGRSFEFDTYTSLLEIRLVSDGGPFIGLDAAGLDAVELFAYS